MPSGMSCLPLLCVFQYRSFRPSFRPLVVPISLSVLTSLLAPSPFVHPCLSASHLLPSFIASPSLSLLCPLLFTRISPSFDPLDPASTHSLSFSVHLFSLSAPPPPPRYLWSSPIERMHQLHFTRPFCFSLVWFWFFVCLDNCPYFTSLFRDMMRKMVKQMRAGREWRADSQDGSNTIIFLVEYW